VGGTEVQYKVDLFHRYNAYLLATSHGAVAYGEQWLKTHPAV
jgi:hypothetical protein